MKKFLLMCLMGLFCAVSYAKNESCMVSDNDVTIVKCDLAAVVAPVAFSHGSLVIGQPKIDTIYGVYPDGSSIPSIFSDTLTNRVKDINLLVHIDPGLNC